MFRIAITLASLVLLGSCSTEPQISPLARSDLAPTGKLRVGINFGNKLLTAKDPASGEPRGVAVDLARELARRVGVPIEIVAFNSAGTMAEAVNTGAWDVAFLAADPQRADEISFTAAYAEIEFAYLVPAGSPLRTIADVDREGVRIAIAAKGAADLFLTSNLRRARLERVPGVAGSFKLFVAEKLDALAGLRPALMTYAEKLPGSRILDGRLGGVPHAIGTPRGRDAGAKYLRQFVENAKATGLVTKTIENNGARDLSVAPMAAAQ